MSALAALFDSFISQHNFTLDFESSSETVGGHAKSAVVYMVSSMASCMTPVTQCYIPPMSLLKFEHHNTLLFKKSATAVEPFSLPSLAAPFSDAIVEAILLGTSICMIIVLLALKSKSSDVISTCLSVLSGLIGTSLVIRGDAKSAYFYSLWLLVGGVISVMYTSILQSYVVVPGVLYNGLSFDEMTKKNYTFEAEQWKWLKGTATVSSYKASSPMRAREKRLSERVSERGMPLPAAGSKNLSEFVDYYSKAAKRALVVTGEETKLYTFISKLIRRDDVVGKEKFFRVPLWWNFMYVERASLLASSVEILKEAGLLQYFLQLTTSKTLEDIAGGSRKKELNSTNGPAAGYKVPLKGGGASLNDALIRECFALFMYGMFTALAAFLAEQFKKLVTLKLNNA